MEPDKLERLAHAVSVILAERGAVTQGTQRALRPLADKAAWEASCLLESAGLLEWPTWENASPRGTDAQWQLTGWTTRKDAVET